MKVLARAALIALLAGAAGTSMQAASAQRDAVLTAAFVFNFAKFTEWPALSAGAPIVACVYGDDGIAAALEETVRGQNINGHVVDVRAARDDAAFRLCHLLFVGASEMRRARTGLTSVSALPVLTVSDERGFAQAGGIIEMYVEDGRMRFAINVTAVGRSGLHLSSRLLRLARIVRGLDAP